MDEVTGIFRDVRSNIKCLDNNLPYIMKMFNPWRDEEQNDPKNLTIGSLRNNMEKEILKTFTIEVHKIVYVRTIDPLR